MEREGFDVFDNIDADHSTSIGPGDQANHRQKTGQTLIMLNQRNTEPYQNQESINEPMGRRDLVERSVATRVAESESSSASSFRLHFCALNSSNGTERRLMFGTPTEAPMLRVLPNQVFMTL